MDAVRRLGGAEPGDKTMIDAAVPFAETLEREFGSCNDLFASVSAAAVAAKAAAERTGELTARLGRSRVLGDKSLGTPDPGAVSFAMLMEVLAERIGKQR